MLLLELSPWVSMFINYHTMAPDGFNHALMKQNRSALALEHTHTKDFPPNRRDVSAH